MRKLLYSAVFVIPLITGCGESLKFIESEYIIKVTGTPGVNFKGNYTLPGSTIKPVQVNGTVPAEYKAKGIAVICVFRKLDVEGTLKVEVIKDKMVVDSSETSKPLGVITMGKVPNQEGVINMMIGKLLDVLKL
jgi:hypothetical protein